MATGVNVDPSLLFSDALARWITTVASECMGHMKEVPLMELQVGPMEDTPSSAHLAQYALLFDDMRLDNAAMDGISAASDAEKVFDAAPLDSEFGKWLARVRSVIEHDVTEYGRVCVCPYFKTNVIVLPTLARTHKIIHFAVECFTPVVVDPKSTAAK